MDLYRIFLSPEYFDKYCSSRSIDLKIPPQKVKKNLNNYIANLIVIRPFYPKQSFLKIKLIIKKKD